MVLSETEADEGQAPIQPELGQLVLQLLQLLAGAIALHAGMLGLTS